MAFNSSASNLSLLKVKHMGKPPTSMALFKGSFINITCQNNQCPGSQGTFWRFKPARHHKFYHKFAVYTTSLLLWNKAQNWAFSYKWNYYSYLPTAKCLACQFSCKPFHKVEIYCLLFPLKNTFTNWWSRK